MKLLSFLVIWVPLIAAAADPGRIAKLEGHVTRSRNSQLSDMTPQTTMTWGDVLAGDAGSALIVELPNQKISLRGPFSLTLKKVNEKASAVHLAYGKLRMWIMPHTVDDDKQPMVTTPNATAGVRGTDFVMTFDRTLQETEVVCLEHAIHFAASDNSSAAEVKSGQWGGRGGRFGETIRPPIQVPVALIREFQAQLALK